MLNRLILLIIFSFGIIMFGWSQECDRTLMGKVIDAESDEPIAFANIFIQEKNKGAVSDENGAFVLNHLCGVSYTIVWSYVGYQSSEQIIKLSSDKTIMIKLYPTSKKLNDVVITGNKVAASSRETQQLSLSQIDEDANKNLGNMLEALPGVSALKSGSGISKPVVQGLYGNRLPILNNGIAQSGQQWGNDHSPEIDPLVANSISVLSGVQAMEYQGRSLGSMILVQPQKIKNISQVNGNAAYYFNWNGVGNGLNFQLQKQSANISWKVNGTVKKSGDQRAANYYLTNTGVREANVAIQLEKWVNEKWYLEAYLSSFNTEIGVLRGSHIGNLSDLEAAFLRDEPLYTNDYFSYDINAPRQTVNHQLIKLKAKCFIDNQSYISFTCATQINNRNEFDIRRAGRSSIPAMSLLQLSQFMGVKYSSYLFNDWKWNAGMQFNFIDNTNDPETGILPLIPDYYAYESGVFTTITKNINQWQIDLGGRYDYQNQKIAAISNDDELEIVRYNNNFNNLKFGADASYHLTSNTKIIASVNYASRNPEVNELYSDGLHHGVGAIEEGDPDLKTENAIKSTLSLNTTYFKKMEFEWAIYHQYIDNYIFLNPQDELRLTIQGAFPVYQYEQTNANIYGADITAHYHVSGQLKATVQYSYLRGDNLSDDVPLINMSPNNIKSSLRYHWDKVGAFNNLSVELNQQYVFKQNHLLAEQDYVLPPDAYNLIGCKVAAQKQMSGHNWHFYAKADNVLNESYRDYMNRMRYFADDLGINITVGCKWDF